MSNEIMRVSAKGQLTIPVSIRKKINIREFIRFYSPTAGIPPSDPEIWYGG